jgi:hypothetical protein
MIIAGEYSFNNGKEFIEERFPHLLDEITFAIQGIDAANHRTKISKEKSRKGKTLYSPSSLNVQFKNSFKCLGWKNKKEPCVYSKEYYTSSFKPSRRTRSRNVKAFRDMDFVKEKLGIEVQFGKYSFMVYDVCAKMTIFKKLGHIEAGIEIVPIKQLAEEMSSGVSYFEQFVWDLHHRGVSNVDIPVLVLGLDAAPLPETGQRPKVDINTLFAGKSDKELIEIEQNVLEKALWKQLNLL